MGERLNTNFDLKNIVFTLKYGYFNGESPKKLFVAFAFLAGLFFLGMILGIVMAIIQQFNYPESIGSFIGTLMVILIAIPIVPVIVFLLLYRNQKISREIKKWLDDAILVDAFIQEIDRIQGFMSPLIKFQIDFDIDGVHYVRTSEEENQVSLFDKDMKGYFQDIVDYVNRKVKILYSTKYDQVMILKTDS